jgi:hypothetical protein
VIEMASSDVTRESGTATGGQRMAPRADGADHRTPRRKTTETKAAFKTTEFMAFVAMLIGVFIAGLVVESSDTAGLGAKQVWLYATILTVGYMISRGLAKMGSRDPYDD